MNSSGTNKGGWDESELRAWLNSDFFDLCSDELQSIIRPVVKLTSAGDRSGEIIKSIDRIFILSEKEVYGRVFYSVPGEGHWYEYYRLEDIPYFLLNEEGERVYRHLRSASYNNGPISAMCTLMAAPPITLRGVRLRSRPAFVPNPESKIKPRPRKWAGLSQRKR